MHEPFNFTDGALHIWTGAANASGSAIAYVQGAHFNPTWGWQTDPSLSGTYRDHLTGQHARLIFDSVYTFDSRLAKLAQSATAVHFKWTHSSIDGSAGYIAYSGRIDSLTYQPTADGVPYTLYRLEAYANIWSAF